METNLDGKRVRAASLGVINVVIACKPKRGSKSIGKGRDKGNLSTGTSRKSNK